MKTLEIIHLRFAGETPQNLMDIIRKAIGSEGELIDTRFYCHTKLDNDLAVHLIREASTGESGPSDAGVGVAALLKDYGMVAHSVWVECGSLSDDEIQEEGQGRAK
jgi:hypothetical protein